MIEGGKVSDLITSDHPLDELQQERLAALLNTMIPPGDGRCGGGEVDLIAWLSDRSEALIPVLKIMIDDLGDDFTLSPVDDRVTLVKSLSEARPEEFESLLFHIYACYYQDDRVLTGIGLAAGPPFPRGNVIASGDLSLLDPVVAVTRGYRKV